MSEHVISSKCLAVVTQSSCMSASVFKLETCSSHHSVSLLVCRCVQLEAEKASKEQTLRTVLSQLEEQGTSLGISQEAAGQLRAQLHMLTDSCARLEAQVQSVTEGSTTLQARYAALQIQAAQVTFKL